MVRLCLFYIAGCRDTGLHADRMRIQVSRIGLADYETYHYDKEKLKEICESFSLVVCRLK